MTAPNFENLRPGRPDCPSDLQLDRYSAGELARDQAERTRVHAASCEACTARLAASRFEAMPGVDPRRMMARIRQRLDEPSTFGARALAWLRRRRVSFFAVAVGAAAVLVLVPRLRAPLSGAAVGLDGEGQDEVRAKGSPVLRVFRLRANGGAEATSGDRFAPGDAVRFAVDLPSAGSIAIVGVEGSGKLYVAWPMAARTGEARRTAGPGQVLPGAVELDRSTGRETLYLVHCPTAAEPPVCQSRGAGTRPACPQGCTLAPFVLDKGE